ncbi:response regulator [Halovenus rubra]|uniref:Response regulator n=2 Tax=Halovenus rubra TaxID=869890 RepID=A0ACC7DY77_9EURY|nr:response regulator [Halovenus rubra]
MEFRFTEPAGVSVLHVDDDSALVDVASEFLCQGTTSSPSKLRQTRQLFPSESKRRRVDCLISDYNMPEIGGLELVERVKTIGDSLPVILYTGRGSEAVTVEAVGRGVDAYIQNILRRV